MCKTARALHLAWQQATTPHRAISGAALTTHGGASMFHFTKKRAVAMAVVGSLALSAGAYAFFTSTGTGGGSASVGTSADIVITATSPDKLYPTTSSLVTVTIANPGGGPQKVGKVKLDSITSTNKPDCVMTANAPNAAFTMADITIDAAIPAGGSIAKDVWLTMNDTGVNQNTCAGAELALHLSSTAGVPAA
jgi:hypothetical protein